MTGVTDYFAVLGLPNGTRDPNAIKKAFREAARSCHPDKLPNMSAEEKKRAEKRFNEISAAYETLKDPEKLNVYLASLRAGPGLEAFFKPDIMEKLMKPKSREAFFEVFRNGISDPPCSYSDFSDKYPGNNSARTNSTGPHGVKRPAETVIDVECSLEELHTGTVKKVEHDGRTHMVRVRAGTKDGATMRIPNIKGFEIRIVQEPHPLFRREGDDLHYTHEVSLKEALLGFHALIPTIDDQAIEIDLTGQVVEPTQKKVIPGKGMTENGNLVVSFRVCFPENLSGYSLQLLRQCLS
eukprot:comp15288_c1_seq1/m.12105 comp15288_c1_seq1/g.12105  ORF comp15288_c1_seq1/g.12105 comp15288_c1_seq1/m.12105 type:complete len:296 (-) comp15288_c1_seq1:240-1127(-)